MSDETPQTGSGILPAIIVVTSAIAIITALVSVAGLFYPGVGPKMILAAFIIMIFAASISQGLASGGAS